MDLMRVSSDFSEFSDWWICSWPESDLVFDEGSLPPRDARKGDEDMINSEASRSAPVAGHTLAAYAAAKPKEAQTRAEEPTLQSKSSTPISSKPIREKKPAEDPRADAKNVKEKDPAYDPLTEQESRQRRLSEMAESMSQTLQRISRFFRPEDLTQPPGPMEIQRRVSEVSNPDPTDPKSRALGEANRKQDPNLRSDVEKQSAGSPLDVVV
jgi:hypothetical protein